MIRCGIYLRLSREDGGRESDSIQNQRLLLQKYLREHQEMDLVAEWVDDGWTGSNFERPGFRAMLSAAANGEIDCLLCKDLSRLGREYIQTGRYMREVFPKMGLRLIAVADYYDSDSADFLEESLLLPVLNLMNDAYCRDISNKVRWQQKTKRELGEYIGAFSCYGYQKSPSDYHKLVVDDAVCEIIRAVYFLRLSGMSAEKISMVLEMGHIPSPRAYKRIQESSFRSGFDGKGQERWSPLAVRRILSNRMYTGVMIQGKDRKLSYKLTERRRLPMEEWIQVEGKVPAIIPSWEAELVEEWAKKRLRCQRGRVYCALFDGYGLTEAEQAACRQIFEAIFESKGREYGGREKPKEQWLQRLFLVLFVCSVHFSDYAGSGGGRKLYICLRVSAAGGKYESGRDICEDFRGRGRSL